MLSVVKETLSAVGICATGRDNGGIAHRPVLTCTREELVAVLADSKGTRTLIMTMDALHKGHPQLVKRAEELGDHVVVTTFVNPAQFAPEENFDAYLRTLDADMMALESVGVGLVWTLSPEDVYLELVDLNIDPGRIAYALEGTARPARFADVALVCTKIVGLVCPDVALLGEKDAQQLAVLRHVFSQLDVSVCVEGVSVVCDTDGVALSSRNHYFLEDERVRARSLSKGLETGRETAANGASTEQAVTAVLQVLETTGGIDVDYVVLVDEGTFDILAGTPGVVLMTEKDARSVIMVEGGRTCRVLLAAKVGTIRLIDNLPVISEVERG